MEREENAWKQEVDPYVLTKSKEEMKKIYLEYLKMQTEMTQRLVTMQTPN